MAREMLGSTIVFAPYSIDRALEGLADSHMAVPLHAHTQEDEVWYVLEGEIAFTVGERAQVGGPGTFVYSPRGTPHTFA